MKGRIALVLAVAVLGVALVLLARPAEDPVEVHHQDSIPDASGYQETFVVEGVDAARATVFIADEPVDVSWFDGACQGFTFWGEELDGLRPMRIEVDDEVVWEGAYGAGSGTPLRDC